MTVRFVFLWTCVAVVAARSVALAARHNILYFIADDLRPEFLGAYGDLPVILILCILVSSPSHSTCV